MTVFIKTSQGWRPFYKACVNSNQLEGLFKSISPAEAQAETGARAQEYADDVDAYINGNLRKEQIFRSFNRPVYGAYGEKL